ncbi:hypothetical protein Btru_056203 [Bulinus truncatus]|nr:hypothetical protein Btru_056203 [Bulinus truncatus]
MDYMVQRYSRQPSGGCIYKDSQESPFLRQPCTLPGHPAPTVWACPDHWWTRGRPNSTLARLNGQVLTTDLTQTPDIGQELLRHWSGAAQTLVRGSSDICQWTPAIRFPWVSVQPDKCLDSSNVKTTPFENDADYASESDNYDYVSGYMSDGDILKNNRNNGGCGGDEWTSGYLSEGGASLYARRLQQRFREGMQAVRECMQKSSGIMDDDR